MMNISNKTA